MVRILAFCFVFLLWLNLRADAQVATSQSKDKAQDKSTEKLSKQLQLFYRTSATAYDFSPETIKTPLRVSKQPVLSWTSHGREGLWSGDVFVWTHQGRAEVIGCLGSWPITDNKRGVFEEFHSLARNPMTGLILDSQSVWNPATPGAQFRPVPNVSPPAKSRARRLIQMRRIAKPFSAKMKEGDKTDSLRLLTQPIFRHEDIKPPDQASVVDGAVFAYVSSVGTDPEVLLAIECVEKDSRFHWEYAPVRFTHRELWLHHKDHEVWHVRTHNTPATAAVYDSIYLTRPVQSVWRTELDALWNTDRKKADSRSTKTDIPGSK